MCSTCSFSLAHTVKAGAKPNTSFILTFIPYHYTRPSPFKWPTLAVSRALISTAQQATTLWFLFLYEVGSLKA
jgi:hypothetical protein